MNKRKMTSIALVAAVAISTVQLAYPADVFAHENVNKIKNNNTSIEYMEAREGNISSEKLQNLYIGNVAIVENGKATSNTISGVRYSNGTLYLENAKINGSYSFVPDSSKPESKQTTNIYADGDLIISLAGSNEIGNSDQGLNKSFYSTGKLTITGTGDISTSNSTDAFSAKSIDVEGTGTIDIKSSMGGLAAREGDINISNSVINIKTTATGWGTGIATTTGNFTMKSGSLNIDMPTENASYIYGTYINGETTISGGKLDIKAHDDSMYCKGNCTIFSGDIKAYNGIRAQNGGVVTIKGGSINIGGRGIEGIGGVYLLGGDVQFSGNKVTSYKNIFIDDVNLKLDNQEKLNLEAPAFVLNKLGNISYQLWCEKNTYLDSSKKIAFVNEDGLKENQVSFFIGQNGKKTYVKGCIANTNGGTIPINTNIIAEKFISPIKENHIFEGWYDNKSLDGEVVTAPKSGNNYYAKWKELNEVTLVYDGDKDGDASTNVSTNINLGTATSVRAVDPTVVKIDGNKVIAVGVGVTTIEYLNGNEVIATQNVKVNAPKGTVAMVDKIPYKNLQDAVNSNNNTKIKVVADVVLNTSLDLSKMKARTIDFGNHKITKSSTFPEKETSLIIIKENKEKITISNAKFDTSKKDGLSAIKVVGKEGDKENHPSIVVENIEVNNVGNNKGSAIYVENASLEIKGDASVTRNTSNHTVVEIQGKDSLVVLDKDSTINKDKTPEIGNNHSDDVIMGNKTDSNDFDNENITSGGGSVTPSIPSTPSKPSKPVYTHKEVIGANRYETAAKVADELGSYDNVVLVNATSTMSDGLAASGLAGKENGAILLTKKDSIPKATMDRIKKVKKVYIIGGENAISQKVANQITATNIKVERIGGKNRVETSELVAEKLGNYSNAFIVNGFKGEADAMSASAIAARYEAPILLTNGKTSTHAKKSGVEYYVVGGTSVVNKSIADKYNAERLAGKDRYATNREVIDEFYSGSDKLYLANGETLVDALTASTIAKNHGIVLVNKKSDNSVLKDKNTVQIGGMNFDIDFE